MKLSVLISTIDDGLKNIDKVLLSVSKEVEYIISHQYTDEKYRFIPKALLRKDVLISQIPGKGLSKSRNNAIKHATGEIAVIADDDVRYKSDYFDTIVNTYLYENVDVACFKIKTPEGKLEYKKYPKEILEIKDFESYSPSSIELTFKLDKIKLHNISFDHRFGLGAKFIGGEEKLFLHDSIDKGLKVKFIPKYVVEHDYESSNRNLTDNNWEKLRKKTAYDCRINGNISLVRAVLGTFKNFIKIYKKYNNPFIYFHHRVSAVIYILLTPRNK